MNTRALVAQLPPSDTRRRLMASGVLLAACGRVQATDASQRVATLYQGATDIVVALGVQPAAVVESWSERPAYRYLRDALKGAAPLGLETQPSLEDLIYLRPTLIVGSRFRHARIETLLTRIAPTVMLDDVYDFLTGMREIGQAIGRAALADSLLAEFAARTAQLRARLAATYGARWPLTVSVLDFRDDHVRAYLENSYSGLILGQLGFARTSVQRGPTRVMEKLVSPEQIPVADADVFFVLQRSGSARCAPGRPTPCGPHCTPRVAARCSRWITSAGAWRVVSRPRTRSLMTLNGCC